MIITPLKLKDLLGRIDSHTTEQIRHLKHIGVAGPSGSGKSSILFKEEDSIVKMNPNFYSFSISGTTRLLRLNEIHGKDYFGFHSVEEFKAADFIEDNSYIGNGNHYGTLLSEIERIAIRERKRACFDIDINGAVALKNIFKKDFFFTFLDVPIETLYDRLLRRMPETGESEAQVERRIIAAVKEKRRVQSGEIQPDYVLKYDNTMRPGEAANDILLKSRYPLVVS